jgi:hypothetical protein
MQQKHPLLTKSGNSIRPTSSGLETGQGSINSANVGCKLKSSRRKWLVTWLANVVTESPPIKWKSALYRGGSRTRDSFDMAAIHW